MKPPEGCASIEEVREGIDALDREMIALIGRHARFVEAAARFKTGESSVRPLNAARLCSKRAAGGPKRRG